MPRDALGDTPNFMGLTYASGDFVSLFSLFFDNLSTLLGLSGAILGLNPQSALLKEIVYQRIIPAAGVMLFLGNAYYTWQAIRMRNKYNKPYTAQPYGTSRFRFVLLVLSDPMDVPTRDLPC
jgi:adenine/guanine/hypoxanthine permease